MENVTVLEIMRRLPQKPLLTVREIADAFGLRSQSSIMRDISLGKLDAVVVSNRYIVSRESVLKYLSKGLNQ